MTMIRLRRRSGDSPEDVSLENPIPVEVMRDVQSRGIQATTFQISCATTTTLLVPANPRRRSVKITNITGTQVVYLGFNTALTSSNGDYLHSSSGSNTSTFSTGAVYGLAITGAQTLSILEEEYMPLGVS